LRRVLGDEHPNTLSSISNMGALLKSQGKLAEAELYFREAVQGCRRVLGDEHPTTLSSISNMGAALESEGRLAEARPYYREALEGRRRVLGNEHPKTLGSIASMAALLIEQGNHAEAAVLLVPAEDAVRQTFTGGNTPRLAGFLVALGQARAGLDFEPKRFALAEANLIEAHSILVEARGATHKDTRACEQGLVELYDAWHAAQPDTGYDTKAAAWRAKLAKSTGKPAPRQDVPQGGTELRPEPSAQPATEPAKIQESTSRKTRD
jgi:non-specific serine/threonine protein kinase/serine/threonine-protein kinase